MPLTWMHDQETIDWQALSDLYRIAPLGEKNADHLRRVFGNSMFKCFVFDGSNLVGVGRVLADGGDCAYICDIAVHPEYQGQGLGKRIVRKLLDLSESHKKIILYANPGKEGFYQRLGFRRMNTAMAIFEDQKQAIASGLVGEA